MNALRRQVTTGLLASLALTTSAVTRYVDVNSTNPTPPYTNWTTAAVTIQDAVDAALPGDEIVVTNGVYASGGRAVGTNVLVNRVAVDKPLTLRSVNGPQSTVIQGAKAPGGSNGDGAIRCVYLTSGAHLSGFTLTNGATQMPPHPGDGNSYHGGGLLCESSSATASDCVIIGNSAFGWGGGVNLGTLRNCTLAGNQAGWGGGGAQASTLDNCVVSNNSTVDIGGGVAWGTLTGCTVAGNSARNGGGVFNCWLHECVVTRNSATSYGGGRVLAVSRIVSSHRTR